MRILLPGGSGQAGTILARFFHARGDDVTVLSRTSSSSTPWRTEPWDALTLGPWTAHLEGADVVIGLAGRTVNTRYTAAHRREILDSRTGSTAVLAEAIAQASNPPGIWLNASTATIYRHSLDRPQDERTGEHGGHEPGVPASWGFGVGVGEAWERALFERDLPHTRRVAMRISMVMSPDSGGVFNVLSGLVRKGLGGTQGPGNQFVAWMHDEDFACACAHLISTPALIGPVNLCAPHPLPNRDFMRDLRRAWRAPIGLPAPRTLLELGAIFLRTETELILKSRYVVPARLLETGFHFENPIWQQAATDLVRRARSGPREPRP